MPPRVLHVISDELALGTLKQVDLLCKGQREQQQAVTVVALHRRTSRTKKPLRFDGEATFIERNWSLWPSTILKLRQVISSTSPSVIHTWGNDANAHTCVAAVRKRIPVIHSQREVARHTMPLFNVVRALRGVTRIVGNEEYIRQYHLAKSVPEDQVTIVQNGVLSPPEARTVRSIHAALDLHPDAMLIGVVGQLIGKKRLKDLIWALDLLRVVQPNAHLIVVGEGPERDRLEQFAQAVCHEPSVHFLGHRNDVDELLSQFFCLWQASEEEGCSNAVLEAMSMGVPVIASDTMGHRAILTDDVTGRLVPLSNCAEFARKTNLLLGDPSKADRLGDAARSHVQTQYTVERMVQQYMSNYESVLADRAA